LVPGIKSGSETRVPPGADKRIIFVGMIVLLADQLTKLIVVRNLRMGDEYVLLDGFFRFVHWGNTGAAWSLFRGNNHVLTIVAIVAVIVLFMMRRHFGAETRLGQFALGLMFGGIVGNIIDRVRFNHVVDFIYFYVYRRSGAELGFPAFNIADSGICVGVGLLFVLSWQMESAAPSGRVESESGAGSEAADSKPTSDE
jgi:signal peptidase II